MVSAIPSTKFFKDLTDWRLGVAAALQRGEVFASAFAHRAVLVEEVMAAIAAAIPQGVGAPDPLT